MSQGKKANPAKGKKAGKAHAEEKGEDVLQAVILADSFQERFTPLTIEKPRCLLPLANTPLVEYTLEYLAMNGVQEVIIYSKAHIDQVEQYISESPRWSPTSKITPFQSLEFIRVSQANSIGDFLRDLDARGLIEGDFLLVHGDLVANLPLDGALARHRARREANRDAIMTMILRDGGVQDHRTKTHGITPVFAVEPSTGRCLHYEEMTPLDADRYLTLDPAILENPEVEMRADLIDCGIDICTPDVLALWTESFDCELPRKNFLHNVLKDWELNGKLIYTEILEEGYAARASNLQMYDALSRDVLGRWTYPMVPESNLIHGHTYERGRNGVCAEMGVVLGPSTDVTSSVIGQRTSIGSGTTISNSIIGRRCNIGANVRIENCYIWDDVTIGDNTRISQSLLADSVIVGKGCDIPPGSLISFGVRISDSILFTKPITLSLFLPDRSPAFDDTSLLGPGSRGASYEVAAAAYDDENPPDPSSLQKSLIYSTAHLNLSQSSISTFNSEDEDEEADEVSSRVDSLMVSDQTASRSRLSSFASSEDSAAQRSGANFHGDAVHGLLDALRGESDDFESARLEFMGLRFANDASDSFVRRAVAAAFVRRAAELMSTEGPSGGLEPTKAAEQAVKGKRGVSKFISDVGVGGGSVPEQVDFIVALQRAAVSLRALEPARAGSLLAALLQQLYDNDVLEEDGILAWWGDKRAQEGESMAAARERCKVLVEWLENAEEDDDSDEEDDDDDDE